jgi:hypothetical protein
VQPQGLAEGQRLEQVLQGVVGQQGDGEHGQGDTDTLGAEGDEHNVHQPDDGEAPGVAPERVDGVGHDLPAHLRREPQQPGDPARGGVGHQPPVLHQEQQDEQAGDDAHDQHGGRVR